MLNLCLIIISVNSVFGGENVLASPPVEDSTVSYSWLFRILANCAGYLLVLLPLWALRTYVVRGDKSNVLKSSSTFSKLLHQCFIPEHRDEPSEELAKLPLPVTTSTEKRRTILHAYIESIRVWFGMDMPLNERTSRQFYTLLAVCTCGLQIAYVLWGIMQERIMTRSYGGEMFGSSQYLVFCNRLITLFVVVPFLYLPLGISANPLEPGRRAPFFEYSFASFSNIVSSWCQYEALKYVSFPTQVLSKSCKVIPVMLMGKIIQRRTYSWLEYSTAGMISAGLSLFILTAPSEVTGESSKKSYESTIGGTFLIIGYMLFDSFTANWQDKLFKKYSLSALQVMAGVNFWSVILALIPLVQQGDLFRAIQFGTRHAEFNVDVLLSASCSALGQLFIFLTISNFGPVTFVLIMTMRMAFSILISCLLFSHPLSAFGIVGVLIVFASLFIRIYARSRAGTRSATVAK